MSKVEVTEATKQPHYVKNIKQTIIRLQLFSQPFPQEKHAEQIAVAIAWNVHTTCPGNPIFD